MTDGRADPATCARAILEVVPAAMREIRRSVREIRPAGLSEPQFRALEYVGRHPGTSLSPLAERLGVRLPSASGLVERLVVQGRLRREADPAERRRVCLWPTSLGEADLAGARDRVADRFGEALAELGPADRERLADGIAVLEGVVCRLLPGQAQPNEPASSAVTFDQDASTGVRPGVPGEGW